ncbi:MAG: dihydrofolate reductase [Bdellovibrionota bacterium]
MKVKLIAIAALGKSRQIGLKNDLPWSLPDEYQHFQDTVENQYVLIGRKNFESHDGDVKGTTPLILTRDKNYHPGKGKAFSTLKEVIDYAESEQIQKLFVIGGAEIYRLTLPFLSEFLWTEVDYDGEADAWFPEFKEFAWTILAEEKHPGWILRKMVKSPQKI